MSTPTFPKLPNSVYQSGHATLYDGFQMHQYAMRYAEQAAQPDCRTCTQHVVSCWSNIKCVNGDQHIEAPRVVLWRTE